MAGPHIDLALFDSWRRRQAFTYTTYEHLSGSEGAALDSAVPSASGARAAAAARSLPTSVADALRRSGLEQYTAKFESEGYDDLPFLRSLAKALTHRACARHCVWAFLFSLWQVAHCVWALILFSPWQVAHCVCAFLFSLWRVAHCVWHSSLGEAQLRGVATAVGMKPGHAHKLVDSLLVGGIALHRARALNATFTYHGAFNRSSAWGVSRRVCETFKWAHRAKGPRRIRAGPAIVGADKDIARALSGGRLGSVSLLHLGMDPRRRERDGLWTPCTNVPTQRLEPWWLERCLRRAAMLRWVAEGPAFESRP